MKTKTHTVGSHVDLVDFLGVPTPVGFLGSFRKKSHTACESGKGFIVTTVDGVRSNVLCQCAVVRAHRKIQQVGADAFRELGEEWKGAAMEEVRRSEELCRSQGSSAADGDVCPYPEGSDQAIAWTEGYKTTHSEG